MCQYENTSNGDFLIDRHPQMKNVWLAGGGSGHGFKHGPMVGEYVTRQILDGGAADPRFALANKGTQAKACGILTRCCAKQAKSRYRWRSKETFSRDGAS